MKETVLRARAFAFIHRRLKKREYRALWITRLSAACRARGMSYSNFIRGLTIAGVGLNRKTLSELAIHEPAIFDEIVEVAKQSIPEPSPQPQPA
jgi:large subunit ribosomal protein L20